MAAPLSFPDGYRDKRGSMLGQRNENPRLRTYMRLRAGIFSIEAWYATTTNFYRTSIKNNKFSLFYLYFLYFCKRVSDYIVRIAFVSLQDQTETLKRRMTHTERKKLRPGVLRFEFACELLREGESSFFAKRMTNRLGHTNLFASLSHQATPTH